MRFDGYFLRKTKRPRSLEASGLDLKTYLHTMLGLSFAKSRQAWCCLAAVAESS